jgi:hypothetical protein
MCRLNVKLCRFEYKNFNKKSSKNVCVCVKEKLTCQIFSRKKLK